jgi:hypothetical protein
MLAVAGRTPPGYQQKPADVARGEAARLSWAWDGLCFGLPVIERSREGFRDAVNNIRGTPGSLGTTTIKMGLDTRGNSVIQFPEADDNYLEWPDSPAHDRPSTALTAYARLRYLGSTGAGSADGGILTNVYATTSPWTTWGIQTGQVTVPGTIYGTLAIGTTPFTVGSPPAATTGTMPTTEYVSCFFRWRSGEAPRLDILGERGNVLSSMTHASTVSGSLGYNAGQGIRVNSSENTNAQCDMHYSQAMVWSRRLTDIEMQSLVSDPFGWYAPRRETLLVGGPFPVFPPPTSVANVSGTSPYSGAGIAPTFGSAGVVTAYTVTAGSDVPAEFTRTVSGVTTTDTVAAGDTQVYPTGAATASDVTYVALDSDDTGV